MIRKIVKKFIRCQVTSGIIKKEEANTYLIGYQLLINKVLSILLMLLIAAIQGNIIKILIFIGAFSILRQYTGGIHFSLTEVCIGVSAVICIFVFPAIQSFLRNSIVANYMIEIWAMIFIFKFSPVDSKEKRLESVEHKIYQNYARNILVGEVIVYGIGRINDIGELWMPIETAHILIAIGLVLGKVKNFLNIC